MKVLVVVEGDRLAQEVAHQLNNTGYAVFTEEAPSFGMRAHLLQLRNWPVFLVSSEVFSGNALAVMNAAFVFSRTLDMESLVALEYKMAFNGCFKSVLVAPLTDHGLASLGASVNDFRNYQPIRL